MSGIDGIFHLNGQSAAHADLAGMVDTLAHRGPDDQAFRFAGPVGLGHRMLWTTQESLHEHQS